MERMIVGRNSNKPVPLEIQALNRQAMEISSHGDYPGALKLFSRLYLSPPTLQRHSMKWADASNVSGDTKRQSKDMTRHYDWIHSCSGSTCNGYTLIIYLNGKEVLIFNYPVIFLIQFDIPGPGKDVFSSISIELRFFQSSCHEILKTQG